MLPRAQEPSLREGNTSSTPACPAPKISIGFHYFCLADCDTTSGVDPILFDKDWPISIKGLADRLVSGH